MSNINKMDSLLKLTDDIIMAVEGITSHAKTVMTEIFEDENEHPNSDTREPDESLRETRTDATAGNFTNS